ncbi:NRDE family protein [uncultured Tenacibaculum sp.]|uniref:NRDE family protein n=1 Tax=uncultured Tenacibaculum sp. TaxID=174713 RepID=UPI00262B8541|nr:NRDE family protein [uncultured Tenacibaculum sp.]
MCTVAYLPFGNNDFILTSNRYEDPKRNTIEPQKYVEDNVELFYPKDSLARGAWVEISGKDRLVCLLN